MVDELHDVKPAKGFDQVYYPGEIQEEVKNNMQSEVFQFRKKFMII